MWQKTIKAQGLTSFSSYQPEKGTVFNNREPATVEHENDSKRSNIDLDILSGGWEEEQYF